MVIYLIYMVSPVLLYSFVQTLYRHSINNDLKAKRDYLVLFAIIMTLMIGLRSRYIGSTDTAIYCKNWVFLQSVPFDQLGQTLKSIDLENGYLIAAWIFSHIFKDAQMLLLLSAAFYSISICRFVYKNCDNVALGLLVFNCLGLFNFMIQGLRQGIAMCICLFALEKAKSGQLFKFILLVLLASTFHASAIIFLLVYLIRSLKLKVVDMAFFFSFATIAMFSLPQIFEIMNKAMNEHYGIGTGAEQGGVIAILIYICIIGFALLVRREKEFGSHIFFYMALIGVSSLFLRNNITTIAERIGLYFAFAQMPLVANSITALKNKRSKAILSVFVVLLCFGVALYKASYSVVIPYNFFWQVE